MSTVPSSGSMGTGGQPSTSAAAVVGEDLVQLISSSKPGKIRRPPNAFMLYAREYRRKVSREHPNETNKKISTLLGQGWRNLEPEQRRHYYEKATLLDKLHKEKYPQYVYNPKEARMRKQTRMRTRSLRRGGAAAAAAPVIDLTSSTSTGTSNTFHNGSGIENADGATPGRESVQVRIPLERLRNCAAGSGTVTSFQETEKPRSPARTEDRYQPPDLPDRTFPLLGAMEDPPQNLLPDDRQRLRNIAATVSSRESTANQDDTGHQGCSCAENESGQFNAQYVYAWPPPNFPPGNPLDPPPPPSGIATPAPCADGLYLNDNAPRFFHPYGTVPLLPQPMFPYHSYPQYYFGRLDGVEGGCQHCADHCDCQQQQPQQQQQLGMVSTDPNNNIQNTGGARGPVPHSQFQGYGPSPLHCVPFPPPRGPMFVPPMVPHAYYHQPESLPRQFRCGPTYGQLRGVPPGFAPAYGPRFLVRGGNNAAGGADYGAVSAHGDGDAVQVTAIGDHPRSTGGEDRRADPLGMSTDARAGTVDMSEPQDAEDEIEIKVEHLQEEQSINVED